MLSFLVDNKENLDKVKYEMVFLMLFVCTYDRVYIYNTKLHFDRCRIMQMTLIHDLAECIVGDITPHCGVPPDVKHKLEDEAMEKICKLLGDKGPMILEMFRVRMNIARANRRFLCSPSFSNVTVRPFVSRNTRNKNLRKQSTSRILTYWI